MTDTQITIANDEPLLMEVNIVDTAGVEVNVETYTAVLIYQKHGYPKASKAGIISGSKVTIELSVDITEHMLGHYRFEFKLIAPSGFIGSTFTGTILVEG